MDVRVGKATTYAWALVALACACGLGARVTAAPRRAVKGVDIAMPAPVGTRIVQVQLRCGREVGMACSAWFDDVSLVANHPSE